MHTKAIAATVVLALAAAAPAAAVSLARDGKAQARIVLADDATLAEQTAARELAEYLGKVTGGEFPVSAEVDAPAGGGRIYVGPTAFAASKGVKTQEMGPEEWVMRTVGDDLILAGGRPRGTLYAAYRFLEDVVGVHWWSPWEEGVPSRPTLEVADLDRTAKPVLRYRDIYMLYGHDGGRCAARNRLNRGGDARIDAQYGGCMDYGPPYHVHTFYMYIPPDQYFGQHPEWFSLIKSERSGDHTQLCLTNAELRQVFLGKLRAYIEDARQKAAAESRPAPVVFDVSQNDWAGMCQCENCQAITQAEGSEAGPLLDFVNYLADAIKDDYPDVYLDTLAYQMTQQAPKTIRPRDNVIIRLCDTTSNFTRAITDPENEKFREHLLSWARMADNLRVWDYAVTYAPYYGLPLPSVHTYAADYRFYAEHNVEGVFTEHEFPVLADLRDFKVWMMMKLLEDPYRDYDDLVRTFTDGFYGPAGGAVREYVAALEAASAASISYLSMGASPQQYRYLDLDFVRKAQGVFDRAEAAVAGDDVLLRRVRHARLPLDRASVVRFPTLMKEWIAAGNQPEAMPLDRDAIAARYGETWHQQADLRLPEGQRAAEKQRADEEVAALTARKAYVPLPERFRALPAGTVFDFTADQTRDWRNIVKVVPDPEAESGITNRLEFPTETDTDKHPLERYKLPMPWGLYDQINKTSSGGGSIKPEDVEGPGYHWYKMGTFRVGPSYYLYFFWSWIIQVDIDSVLDPANPDQEFDVWARIRFEGPGFPHGQADQENAICVERVVLVKAGAE